MSKIQKNHSKSLASILYVLVVHVPIKIYGRLALMHPHYSLSHVPFSSINPLNHLIESVYSLCTALVLSTSFNSHASLTLIGALLRQRVIQAFFPFHHEIRSRSSQIAWRDLLQSRPWDLVYDPTTPLFFRNIFAIELLVCRMPHRQYKVSLP